MHFFIISSLQIEKEKGLLKKKHTRDTGYG